MRKMIVAMGAALLLSLSTGAQAQSRVQSQLGEPLQFVELTPEMKNFLNRYAKAATGKACRTFDTVLGIGGMVLADPAISSIKVEELFREMEKEVKNNPAEYGRGAKVLMDQPKNIIVLVTNEPGSGPAMSLVQIRGARMLFTACAL